MGARQGTHRAETTEKETTPLAGVWEMDRAAAAKWRPDQAERMAELSARPGRRIRASL
jgi:hypothetical protein